MLWRQTARSAVVRRDDGRNDKQRRKEAQWQERRRWNANQRAAGWTESADYAKGEKWVKERGDHALDVSKKAAAD